jgi:nitrilase
MGDNHDVFTVAAVQAAPVFMQLDPTIERCCDLATEAAARGARLVVFPEAFVPTYPLWVWHVPAGQTRALRELYAELLDNAVSVSGAAVERLGAVARAAHVTLVVGVNERNDEASGTTLYNSLLYFGPDGRLLGTHRKLVPTAGERLVHGQGDGSTLAVHTLEIGRLGGLICWENYMPLARYALYAWGVELYVAPTWDRGEPWLSTLRHIAKEARAYVIGCCSAVRRDDVPDNYAFKALLGEEEWVNPGDSAIIDPDGKLVAGPLHERQEILYGVVERARLRGSRWQLDVAGHYARPDVFELRVDTRPRPLVATLRPEEAQLRQPDGLADAADHRAAPPSSETAVVARGTG